MKRLITLIIILVLIPHVFINDTEKMESLDLSSSSDIIDDELANMTLDEKIGQMLIININCKKYDTKLDKILKTIAPSGIIIKSNNITTYDNTVNLVKEMQKNSKIPLIISIDEEGGNVQRLLSMQDINVTSVPYMEYVGNTNDTSIAYSVGQILGYQVKSIGVNLDFAPVVDINSNALNKVIGKRSFGSDANNVSNMANALKKGIESIGVNTCLKHFPGHGDTSVDSHDDIPIVNKTLEELMNVEFVPYINAIKNGVDMIMIGHIALPNVTGDNTPASLSRKIVTNVLKEKLGYDGLIITDALNMGAVTKNYDSSDIYIMAINAGIDILLMPELNAVDIIKNAVSEGKISIDRINESVKKILTYKNKYIKEKYLDASYLNKEEYNDVLDKINILNQQ